MVERQKIMVYYGIEWDSVRYKWVVYIVVNNLFELIL